VTTVGTIDKLEAERLGDGVVVVRLTEPPGAGEWEWLQDSVHGFAGEAPLVILRGPGWSATPVAELMAVEISQELRRVRGAQVAIDSRS